MVLSRPTIPLLPAHKAPKANSTMKKNPPTSLIAIIDIGSNSIRLVIFKKQNRKLLPLIESKSKCGLGRGLSHTHLALHPKGMKTALATLRKFARILAKYKPAQTRAVATAAMRRVQHTPAGKKFHKQAEAALKTKIKIITGKEEARLGATAIIQNWKKATGLCADLGGASLEITRLIKGEIKQAISLPIGALTLQAEAKGKGTLEKFLKNKFRSVSFAQNTGGTLYTIGGSWRAIGRAIDKKRKLKSAKIHGHKISTVKAMPLLQEFSKAKPQTFAKMGKKFKQRATSLPAAAIALLELVNTAQPEKIIFSGHGLREGLAKKQNPILKQHP